MSALLWSKTHVSSAVAASALDWEERAEERLHAAAEAGASPRAVEAAAAGVLALAAVPKSAPAAVGAAGSVSKVANLYRSQRLAVY